jgi:hypothetical protein
MTTRISAAMTSGLLVAANDLSELTSRASNARSNLAIGGNFLTLADGRAMMLELADLKGAALNFSEGQADAFSSDTLGATSTNETYDAANDYYHSSTDMTLINSGLTASTAPSTGRISVQAEFVDSATVNTDLTAEISRDGGTTWTAVTLAAGAVNGGFTLYEGSADISGQPSGTSMKYRVKTLNTKEIRVSGVVLRW